MGAPAEVVANQACRGLVPGFGGRISAALVWDGGQDVWIPEAMGKPREDQMVGTARERLVELAGRVCYDSLGVGRSSKDYAKHLIEVGHLSVLEHAMFTVEFTIETRRSAQSYYEVDANRFRLASLFLNRPSAFVRIVQDHEGAGRVRVTINPRHCREFADETIDDVGKLTPETSAWVLLREASQELAPSLLLGYLGSEFVSRAASNLGVEAILIDEPETDEEKWVTLFVACSRGCGEEIIRHGDWTAFSRRSTRFTEEGGSEWVLHPLLAAHQVEADSPIQGGIATDVRTALGSFFGKIMQHVNHGAADQPGGVSLTEIAAEMQDYVAYWQGHAQLGMVAQEARICYSAIASRLAVWLKSKGVDPTSARKQSRGAARSMLGLGLETETIMSASVAQWRHMLSMRAADAADAEIRLQFAEAVLPCLRASRYGDRFGDFELVPASDGIGRSLRGGGHR